MKKIASARIQWLEARRRDREAARASRGRPITIQNVSIRHLDTTDVWGGVGNRLRQTFKTRFPESSRALEALVERAAALETWTFDRTNPTDRDIYGGHASPGVGAGILVSSKEAAEKARASGRSYVFRVHDLTAENIELALGAAALIVPRARKSGLSRAVAALGKPSVALHPKDLDRVLDGDLVTVDGTRTAVIPGRTDVVAGQTPAELGLAIRELRDRFGSVITAEASSPAAISRATRLGADRIRIDGDSLLQSKPVLTCLREYLLATEAEPRRRLLEQLLATVRVEANTLISSAAGAGLTFALGTRPPSSYFPMRRELLEEVSREVGLPVQVVRDRVADLGAGNSKLGLRGARWAIKDPDLFAAMARAILEAYAEQIDAGEKVGSLRLLFPAVGFAGEIGEIKARIERERASVIEDFGVEFEVAYGAGIETAGAALNAAQIAGVADFFEYGLPELTETMFGISRDDAERFLPKMVEKGIYPADPFEEPPFDLVGKMVSVGQYAAGETANTFPGSLRGPQVLRSNALLIAEQGGIRELVVPVDHALGARLRHAELKEAGLHAHGLSMADGSLRDVSEKAFNLLVRSKAIQDTSGPTPPSAVPEGMTALEHVEEIIGRVGANRTTVEEALLELPPDIVDALRQPVVDPAARPVLLAQGIGAAPGCGQGRIALSAQKAAEYERAGEPYVLVLNEVHAEEVPFVRGAKSLVSVRGGKTSHAAMIAANSDVPCVMHDGVQINLEGLTARIGRHIVKEGDWITVDGTKGKILAGKVPLLNPAESNAYETIMSWADQHRRMRVLANADTPEEAARAFANGASGVGLVRTEHMFFGPERINAFRAVILGDADSSKEELRSLEEMQLADFRALLQAAGQRTIGVRLLDPPLYEFLPHDAKGIEALARALEMPPEEALRRINGAQEIDSLLGLRGARLALARPEIEAMQVRALARAYASIVRDGGAPSPLEIIVPMINTGNEAKSAKARIESVVREVEKSAGLRIPISLAAMIETPSAALEAAEIAKHVDTFSYGTNDLTQLTLGFGRNVANKFVPELIRSGALALDPTATLDPNGVAKLMKVAQYLGQDETGRVEAGICGGQGSDPDSIRVCEALGLDYVSVPPAQVPKARLGAAQATVAAKLRAAQNRALAAQMEPAGPDIRTQVLLSQIQRAYGALTEIPTPLNQERARRQLDYLVRTAGSHLRLLRAAEDPRVVLHARSLFQAYFKARGAIDLDKVVSALMAEIVELRREAKELKILHKIEDDVATAEASTRRLGQVATEWLSSTKTSTAQERELASNAWAALRALENARAVRDGITLPVEHHHVTRLWHHNDGWDNPHYTRTAPNPEEPMGTYLKRVSREFLDDNGITTHLFGEQYVPDNRPVIFACAHRSGAIDRFVTMATLPLDDDAFMYLVREGSPLDERARESYGEDNKWIIPARSAEETIEKVREGFGKGAKSLITYPEGTGSLMGEARHVAAGTVITALRAGAVIVPVTTHDNFRARPFKEESIPVQIHPPIDPLAIQKKLGGADEAVVIDVVHTLLQFDLGSPYRSLL